jgi:hypothetical protein
MIELLLPVANERDLQVKNTAKAETITTAKIGQSGVFIA